MNLLNSINFWQAQNLPEGFSIRDGVIYGNPSVRGVYDVPVTVSNSIGSSSASIRILCRFSDDIIIYTNGVHELMRLPELLSSIQDGTAQSKYSCSNTQMLIPFFHPLTGELIDNFFLNFCSFRSVTLEDETVKDGLILQFAHPLWKGFAPFGTNSFNRWKYSQLRKWLNSSGDDWFSSSYNADILSPHEGSYTDSGVKGFLSCFPSPIVEAMLPVKVVTQAFFDDYNTDTAIDDPDYIDGHDADITYDKVFIPSLSEMGFTYSNEEFFPDNSFEGTVWDYYSNFTSSNDMFEDINGENCSIITRSAYLEGTDKILCINSSLLASADYVYNNNSAPAPAFVIA